MEPAPAEKQPKSSKRRVSRKRRLVMVVVGVGLGVVCRFIPHEYQGPCAVVTKLLAAFVGVS